METRVYQATFFVALLHLTTSAHFRGGTIQWKPVSPFNGSVSKIFAFCIMSLVFLNELQTGKLLSVQKDVRWHDSIVTWSLSCGQLLYMYTLRITLR